MSGWLRARLWLDRIAAAALLVPLSPVIAVGALLVRRHDGHPAILRVQRIGRGGQAFPMLKLRTMIPAGPGGLAGGSTLTTRDDARVTGVGAVLRRWRVDELPQLVNVVRGEMLLLGSRPEAPDYVDLDDGRWRHVLSVAPGIAGPTQVLVDTWESVLVSGENGESAYRHTVLPVKLALDGWYVRCASPALDLLVVWSLACKLAGRSATRLYERARSAVPEVVALVDNA